MDKISIIGLGKLGSNLYFALKKAGYKQIFKINKKTGKKYLKFALQNSNIIFICTKDSDISNVVELLSPLVSTANSKIIYHTSGALNSDTLKPLKNKKISAGSFHPVQTFNIRAKRYSEKFRGIFIAFRRG